MHDAIVRFAGGSYVLQQFRLECVGTGQVRLKRAESAKDLIAVVAGHSYRRNLACLLTHVQRCGATHIGAAVRQVYGPFSKLRKSCKKIRTDLNHLVRLAACSGYAACDENVSAVAICSSKCV